MAVASSPTLLGWVQGEPSSSKAMTLSALSDIALIFHVRCVPSFSSKSEMFVAIRVHGMPASTTAHWSPTDPQQEGFDMIAHPTIVNWSLKVHQTLMIRCDRIDTMLFTCFQFTGVRLRRVVAQQAHERYSSCVQLMRMHTVWPQRMNQL